MEVNHFQHKKTLRQSLLKTRQSLSPGQWQKQSQSLCHQLKTLPLFEAAETILAYFSFRQEPDLSPLFLNLEKRWGFPRCVEKSLIWHYWQPTDPLCQGKFGLLEPDPNSPQINPTTVDLILVPAIACDSQGYRLGYGGGFYDRLLSQPEWSSIPTVGIIFDFAYLPQLPREKWDQPLHNICTEKQLIVNPREIEQKRVVEE